MSCKRVFLEAVWLSSNSSILPKARPCRANKHLLKELKNQRKTTRYDTNRKMPWKNSKLWEVTSHHWKTRSLKPGIFLDPNPVPSPPPEISLGLKGSAECTALHILRGCVQNSRKGQYEKGVQDLSSTKREKPCIHVHHVRTLTLSEAK